MSNNNAGLRTLVSTRTHKRVTRKYVALIVTGGTSTCTLRQTGGTNVPNIIVAGGTYNNDRRTFRSTVVTRLATYRVSLVILTKFVTVLDGQFASACTNHVLGIRPSLVPSFYNRKFCNLRIRRTLSLVRVSRPAERDPV